MIVKKKTPEGFHVNVMHHSIELTPESLNFRFRLILMGNLVCLVFNLCSLGVGFRWIRFDTCVENQTSVYCLSIIPSLELTNKKKCKNQYKKKY